MKNKQNRTVSVQSTRESGNGISWFSVLKRSWQSALHIDRSQITAVQAVRGTIGFVLPLALGVATGHVVEGVSLAGGAATLGAVGLTYTYRARTRTLLLACAGIILAASIQKGQPIETFPNLKESLSALEHTAQTTNSSAQQATPTDLQVVLTEAKSVVRSINTTKQLLTTRTQQEA